MADQKISDAVNESLKIPCPHCFEPMIAAASRCPHCQAEFDKDEIKKNISDLKTDPKGCAILAFVSIALVITVILISSAFRGAEDGDTQSQPGVMSAADIYYWKDYAKEAVKDQLRDPDSAKFSNLTVHPSGEGKTTTVCGYVNSRNGLGGMTGPQRFISTDVVILEEQLSKEEMAFAWSTYCR